MSWLISCIFNRIRYYALKSTQHKFDFFTYMILLFSLIYLFFSFYIWVSSVTIVGLDSNDLTSIITTSKWRYKHHNTKCIRLHCESMVGDDHPTSLFLIDRLPVQFIECCGRLENENKIQNNPIRYKMFERVSIVKENLILNSKQLMAKELWSI